MRPKIIFLYALIASVALSALIGIAVLIFGNFGEFEIKVLLTTLTITVTSILGLACGAYLETGRGRVMPLSGIGVATVSCVLWIYLVWNNTGHEAFFAKLLLSLTVFSATCAHISLLSLASLDRRFMWSRYTFHFVDWLLTAYLLFIIWNDEFIGLESTSRIVGVLSIIVAALTLMTPIFHKLSSVSQRSLGDIDTEITKLRKMIEELEAEIAKLS